MTTSDYISTAQAALVQAQLSLSAAITTPDQLDRAVFAASTGDALLLDPTLVYPSPFHCTKALIFANPSVSFGQIHPDAPAPTFTGGMIQEAGRFIGIRFKNGNHGNEVVAWQGAGMVTLDRCHVAGDPVLGAKRGVQANAPGGVILDCRIDNIFGPGVESQAIQASDGCVGLTVTGTYMQAAGEVVMFGGGDSASADRMSQDLVFRNNVMEKNPAWRGLNPNFDAKTILELKAVRNASFIGNTFNYSWAEAQVGYAMQLTVRNQDGNAPWSTVQDILIAGNTFNHASACVNVLGLDDTPGRVSQRMQNVTITDNDWNDIDHTAWSGSDKMVGMSKGPINFTFDNNRINGGHFGSTLYFFPQGTDKAQGLRFTNNRYPKSTYGVFADNGTVGKCWPLYTDAYSLFAGNVETA